MFGAHLADDPEASAAVTVRRVDSLSWGAFLYVDDLVTSQRCRGRGLATQLLDRVDAIAAEAGIPGQVQLDSGVGQHRADAHAFYGRRGMWIAGFHFIQRDAHPLFHLQARRPEGSQSTGRPQPPQQPAAS